MANPTDTEQTMETRCVADIEGPWTDPAWDSGLIHRLCLSWSIPIAQLSNEMLATFLRQEIATEAIGVEARRRLSLGYDDKSELYPGELANAIGAMEPRYSNP